MIDRRPAPTAARPIAGRALVALAALVCLVPLTAVGVGASPRRGQAGSSWRLSSSRSPTREVSEMVSELERLTEGLSFSSESDAPVSVVVWRRPAGKPTAQRLAQLAGEPHPELVEQSTVDDFFRGAATPRTWHDAEEREVARRYAAIVLFFKTRLSDVRVFRFGRLTIHAYVIGVTQSGDWVGLATTQVET